MNTRPTSRTLSPHAAVGAVLIGLLLASPAFAQTLYWNTPGAAGGWPAAASWSTDVAGTTASTSAPTATTDAFFCADKVSGKVAVTLGGTNNVRSLTFDTGSTVTLAGGTINLHGAADSLDATTTRGINAATNATIDSAIILQASQTWNVSAGTLTVGINGVISGARSLTKTGAGTLTLDAANTFGGGITLDGGTLILDNSTAAGTGVITINRGTLQGQNTGTFVAPYCNNMAWNSDLTLRTQSKSNVWNGNVTLNAAGITVTGIGSYPSKAPVLAGPISDGGHARGLAVSGILVLAGDSTYGGTTTINPLGNLCLGGASNGKASPGPAGSLSASSAIVDNGTLTFNHTNTVTQGIDFGAAPVTGSGSLVQQGGGTLVLTAVNTYTGATTIAAGVIKTRAANAIARTSRLVMKGGTLDAAGLGQSMDSTTLDLAANSTIDLGAGSANTALTLADSHAIIWSSGATLRFINVGSGDTIHIGVTSPGLTTTQLAQITINGTAATMDANGCLTAASGIPAPASYAP